MLKQTLSIKSTVYPFDYNKNNPMTGFNQWAQHISEEVHGVSSNCENVLIEVKKILNSNLKIKS